MKDRVREALFNLLGPAIRDKFAIDLFGGTGALALEAISRGAQGAVVVERHLPTARVLRQNTATLDVEENVTIVQGDAFHWVGTEPNLPEQPWVVFFSPPYRFFAERQADMLDLIHRLLVRAPEGSLFVVEATDQFDFGRLPDPNGWDVRAYPPAVLAVMSVQRENT